MGNLRLYNITINTRQFLYELDTFTGSLLAFDISKGRASKNEMLTTKVINALNFCNNPYQLSENKLVNNSFTNFSSLKIKLTQRLIKITCKFNFWFAYKLSSQIAPILFDKTEDSINYFRKTNSQDYENVLCLPRSLFAASTSKSFKEKGVIFIGVFLPSNSMHAWIIENGTQPDNQDTIWTNFQPVAALCY